MVRFFVQGNFRCVAHGNDSVQGTPNLFTHAAGGILVAAVDPSSSAAAAGLAAGDVVTGISGSDISVMSHADALRVLQVLSSFATRFTTDTLGCRVQFHPQGRK